MNPDSIFTTQSIDFSQLEKSVSQRGRFDFSNYNKIGISGSLPKSNNIRQTGVLTVYQKVDLHEFYEQQEAKKTDNVKFSQALDFIGGLAIKMGGF